MPEKNKVKFNLCNVHYAVLAEEDTGKYSWGTPERIPGAVSLSLEPKGEIDNFYADGIAYYTIANNQGYEGDLEIAMIPESFRKDVLHEETDTNNVLLENISSEAGRFALLFELDGDVNKIRHVFYNCSAARPSISAKTNEEKREVQTDKLKLQATPLANGYIKAKTGEATTEAIYNGWYKAVYQPDSENITEP